MMLGAGFVNSGFTLGFCILRLACQALSFSSCSSRECRSFPGRQQRPAFISKSRFDLGPQPVELNKDTPLPSTHDKTPFDLWSYSCIIKREELEAVCTPTLVPFPPSLSGFCKVPWMGDRRRRGRPGAVCWLCQEENTSTFRLDCSQQSVLEVV